MKSLRLVLALSFVSVALAGLAKADAKEPAAAAKACSCDCCCMGKADKDPHAGDEPKACGCTGQSAKPVEKVMPKPSYNRKS